MHNKLKKNCPYFLNLHLDKPILSRLVVYYIIKNTCFICIKISQVQRYVYVKKLKSISLWYGNKPKYCIYAMNSTQLFDNLINENEKVDFVLMEKIVLNFWNKNDIFEKSLEKTKNNKPFVFLDGPPFATGTMHYGHALVSIVKDIYGRYKTMRGFYVERRAGWDTHGVPIEMQINKKLNVSTKDDVQKIGIDVYNSHCCDVVSGCSGKWRNDFAKLGRWVDCDNEYKTMDCSYMETVWWAFKTLYEKNLIYKGFKVMAYSTGCTTSLSNFEAGLNYCDVIDQSLIVKFKLTDTVNTYLLAWTTTPWTLPDNVALCVGKNVPMIIFAINENNYIVSKNKYKQLEKKNKNLTFIREIISNSLKGLHYIPPFKYHEKKNRFIVLVDDFVKDEKDSLSTGIVHIAPAYGQDDFRVAVENNIITNNGDGLIMSVDDNGCFNINVSDFEKMYVKDSVCENAIITYLEENNLLFEKIPYKHSYPFCWRTNTPLLYRAVTGWFVDISKIKNRLIENNKLINWIPKNIGENRFNNWLETACDWCISRSRYWGTPIPIWSTPDGQEIVCIGSIKELYDLTGVQVTDLHLHSIKHLTIISPTSKEKMYLDLSIFDCWFESGCMPYGQNHYPFENNQKFKNNFPADFVSEGIDQTRGFFYTLSVLSTALFDKPPVKNIVVTGLVLAQDGQKMAKSKQNYPDPNLVLDKYGADALRLYMIDSPVVKADVLYFSEENILKITRATLFPYYHVFKFAIEHLSHNTKQGYDFFSNVDINKLSNFTDKWIISITSTYIKKIHTLLDNFDVCVVKVISQYMEILSNWYLKLNRGRIKSNNNKYDQNQSIYTLLFVLFNWSKATAPITPFLSETIYQYLAKFFDSREISVHLCNYPVIDYNDIQSENNMDNLIKCIDIIRELRTQRCISLKQPCEKTFISHPDYSVVNSMKNLQYYLLTETNILQVDFVDFDIIQNYTNYIPKIDSKNLKNYLLSLNCVSSFKKVFDYLKNLSPDIIKKFLIQKTIILVINNFTFSIDSQILSFDHVLLNDAKINIASDLAIDCQSLEHKLTNNFYVAIDTTRSDKVNILYTVKLVHIAIQQLRKKNNIKADDKIIAFLYTHGNRLQKIILNNLTNLKNSTNTNVKLCNDEICFNHIQNHLVYETTNISDIELIIKLVSLNL